MDTSRRESKELNPEARQIIAQLGLEPLKGEGGYFRRRWTSAMTLENGRGISSAIWFLLTPGDFSAWHRFPSEELWLFEAGDPVEHLTLDDSTRNVRVVRLEAGLREGKASVRVAPNAWQAARLSPATVKHGWALLECTVCPAWEDSEFELGNPEALLKEFPRAEEWIPVLTR